MINLFTTSGLIGDSLMNNLNAICLFVDSLVYWCISLLYQVFISISQVNLFDESTLKDIIDRVFTILGVIMLFIMAYQIILLIISPDKLSGDNGAKKLVTKIITSIVLIVLLPTIFKYMQIFQYNVLTSNVIGRVVMGGGSSTTNQGDKIMSAGTNMALTIASAFYHPMDDNGNEYSYIACKQANNVPKSCETYIEVYDKCFQKNNPGALFMNLKLQGLLQLDWWESIVNSERQMKYIPIISTIAGILAIKMIIAFSLDIGVRVAKLGFLQIVSPVPIALNISSSESLFATKWFKALKDTYLDIFMKLIIIYFSMFSMNMVPEVLSNLWAGTGFFLIQMLATVAVILGILQFAKDAPQLIKDLFNMEVNISLRKRLGENEYLQRGLGMARSGVYSAATGGNFFGGAWRGRHGFEQGKSKTDALLEAEKYGSTPQSRFVERLRRGVGLPSSLQGLDDSINKEYNDGIEKINKIRAEKHIKDRMEYNKEASDYRSQIMSKSDDVGSKVDTAFKYNGGLSYVNKLGQTVKVDGDYSSLGNAYLDAAKNGESKEVLELIDAYTNQHHYINKNGETVSLVGKKLSELNEMYQNAANAGESAEVLQNYKEVIDIAQKDVRSQIINKAIEAGKDPKMINADGDVVKNGVKLISANDYRDIISNVNELNRMVEDKKVALDNKGQATVTTKMDSADAIVKDLNTKINIQNQDINEIERALVRDKAQLDRTKEEKTQNAAYKKTTSDDKFLSNEKKNK